MIKILQRYIAKTLVMTTAFTSLVLISVLFLMVLLAELKDIGTGDYGFVQAIAYVFLRLPNALYQFSPILLLLGCIVGLNVLTTHRELTVMRAAGFSMRQIIQTVLGTAFVMILIVSLLGEWFGPHLSYKAEVRKENAQNAGQAVITAAGVWYHVDNNFIHIEHVIDRQKLEGVTRYQFDDKHRLQASYYAKTMTYQNHQWIMHDVVQTVFNNNRTMSRVLPETPLNLQINTNLLNVGLVEASEMSLTRLKRFAHYLEQNGLQSSEYRFGFWQRVLMPISSLIMIFLAIPFVLGGSQGRGQLGLRLLMGILVGFVFFILNALLGELCIVFQVPPILAAALPLLLFAGLGVYLTRRMLRSV